MGMCYLFFSLSVFSLFSGLSYSGCEDMERERARVESGRNL